MKNLAQASAIIIIIVIVIIKASLGLFLISL